MTRLQPGHQGTPEWYAERRTGYGASDVPKLILGDEEEWRLLHAVKLNLAEELESTETMELGKRLEAPIAQIAAERLGEPLVRVNRLIRHREHSFIFASLDRRRKRGDRRPLEVKKWAVKGDDWGPEGSDIVPDKIAYQLQQQAAVTGAAVIDLAVLFGGSKVELFHVGRDEGTIEEIIALEVAAWAFIARGEMPPWPGPAARAPTLRADEVEATPELLALIDEHEALTARSVQAEKNLDEIKDRIRAYLADVGGARGVLPDGRVVTVSHRSNKPTEKPAWKQIADGYRRRLLDLGIPPEELDFAQTALTTVSAGARPLLVKIKETRRHAA